MAEAVQSVKPKKQKKRKKKEKKSADSELIKLCPAYLSSSGCDRGEMCDDLHICRNYILQKCRSADGGPCSFSHDLQSSQSRGLFQRRFGIHLVGEVLQKFKGLFGVTLQDPPKEPADELYRLVWKTVRDTYQEQLRDFLLSSNEADKKAATEISECQSHNEEKQSHCTRSCSKVAEPAPKQEDKQLQEDEQISGTVPNVSPDDTQRKQSAKEKKSADSELIKLCPAYLTSSGCDKGETCDDLHICPNYILQKCRSADGGPCPFSHDLQSSQSRGLFQRRFGIHLVGEVLQKFKGLFGVTIQDPPKEFEGGVYGFAWKIVRQKYQDELRDFLLSFTDADKKASTEKSECQSNYDEKQSDCTGSCSKVAEPAPKQEDKQPQEEKQISVTMAEAVQNVSPKMQANQRQRETSADSELIKLCPAYVTSIGCDRGEMCDDLHICRNYFLQKCRSASNGGPCLFSHDLQSSQSRGLFQRRFGIYPLKGEVLQTFKVLFGATLRDPQEECADASSRPPWEVLRQIYQDKLKEFLLSFANADGKSLQENPGPHSHDDEKEQSRSMVPSSEVFEPPADKEDKQLQEDKQIPEAVQNVKQKEKRKRKKKEKKSVDSELIKLCPAYLTSSGCDRGEMCDDLHICRNYILQKCRPADKVPCPFSHNLQSNQSRGLFQRRFGIYPLEGKVLQKFKMLFGATIQDSPKEFAEESSRAAWETARQIDKYKLRNFLLSFTNNDEKSSTEKSECNSDKDKQSGCTISSNEIAKPALKHRDIQLQDKRIPESIQNEKASATQKRHTTLEIPAPQALKADQEKLSVSAAISDPPNSSPQQPELCQANSQLSHQKDPQICLYYLRGCCSSEQAHEHFRHLPNTFQWQIRDGLRGAWLDLTQEANFKMEKYYCDVSNAEYTGQLKAYRGENNTDIFKVHKVTITFGLDTLMVSDEMGQFVDIRRISSMSHGQAGGWIKAFSTHWKWYWQNGHKNWIEYPDQKPSDDEDQFTNTRSTSIEKRYLKFKYKQGPTQFEVTTEYGKFHLDFTRMEQTSLLHSHLGPYPLARRPTWNPQINKLSSEGQSNPAKPSIQTGSISIAIPEVKEPTAQASHSKEPDAPVPKSSKKSDQLTCLQEELPSAPPSKPKVQIAHSSCAEGQASQSGAGTEETPRHAPGAQPRSVNLNHLIDPGKSAVGLHSKKSEVAVKPKDASVLPPSSGREPGSPSEVQEETTQICLYFLRGQCKYGGDKFNHDRHLQTPYQWQFIDGTEMGLGWRDFDRDINSAVERSFCDVNTTTFHNIIDPFDKRLSTIQFENNPMIGVWGFIHIRRLSTPSSVLQGSWKKAFCMEWIWYWQDERGIWTIYSEQNAKGVRAGIDSSAIEQKYLEFKNEHGKSEIEFTAGNQRYRLDFGAMKQINISYGTCKKVRRRPNFIPMAERHKVSRELLQAQTSGVIVPATWDSRGTQTGLRLVTLTDRFSLEYRAIANLFWETMSTRDTIVSIDRIQNLELWEDFSKMSERMKKKNGGKPVLQKRLFHGTTTRTYADAICRQNFDWRLSGTNVGTLHGKGSYFARDAKFAHSYTEADDDDNRYIFVAQVLVGSPTQGSPSYVRPPPKDPWNDPHGDLYDCCVDNVEDPEIFVIFEKSQVYPEYLITYEREPSYVYSPSYQQTGNNWRRSTNTANTFSSTPRPTAQASTNPNMYSTSRPTAQASTNPNMYSTSRPTAQAFTNPNMYTSRRSRSPSPPADKSSCTIQ